MMKMEYLLQTEVGSQGQEDTEVKDVLEAYILTS